MFAAEDDADIEVEDQSGALHISFEDGARFVVSPNAPVRQIWISALTTSFKLDWSDSETGFRFSQDRGETEAVDGAIDLTANGRER